MRWWNRYNFPYSNFHDLNLDWIIREMDRLIKEWEILKEEWEQMKIEWVEFQERMERLWEEFKALMEAAWEAYQEQMNAAWEAYKAQMNEEWAEYQEAMNQAWNDYKNELNQEWSTYQQNMNNAWNTYQTAMNQWKDSVDQDIQDKFDEIDAKCAECMQTITDALNDLNQQWLDFKEYVETYLENLDVESIITPIVIQWLEDNNMLFFVTPEQYGAVGDGVNDDTDAFRQCLQQAVAKKLPVYLYPHKTYYFPADEPQPGSIVTKIVNIPANVVVYGNNATLNGPLLQCSGNNVVENLTLTKIDGVNSSGQLNLGTLGSDYTQGNYISNVKCFELLAIGEQRLNNITTSYISHRRASGVYDNIIMIENNEQSSNLISLNYIENINLNNITTRNMNTFRLNISKLGAPAGESRYLTIQSDIDQTKINNVDDDEVIIRLANYTTLTN